LLRQYLAKMTGLSRAQITRLICQYGQGRELLPARYRRHRFARPYTLADVELLAAVDETRETLSGPATRRILQREYQHYRQREYKRLAGISVARLYRLRRRGSYRQRRLHSAVSIGERRRPNPQGQPGYLRVDTVHQGDLDGVKGVYHINAVDEVTQWQVVGAAAKRHGGSAEDASSQEQAIRQFRGRENAALKRQQQGCGNDGRWKTRKTKSRFPSLPNALGNRSAIPTFPQPRRRSSPLPSQSQKGAPATPAPTLSGSSFDEKMLTLSGSRAATNLPEQEGKRMGGTGPIRDGRGVSIPLDYRDSRPVCRCRKRVT
jgi:hypothetical protein